MIGTLKNFGRKLGLVSVSDDERRIEAYIEHNQRKWSGRGGDERNGIVLVGLFSWYPSIHCYSYVTNHLAAKHGGVVRSFYFQDTPISATERIFASFGAERGLTRDTATAEDRELAAQQADEILASLKSKWDVIKIAVDGIPLGDLISDTYARYLAKPTVRLDDPEFRSTLLDALIIFHACRRYLDEHKVLAIVPDHTVYTQCGILIRVAAARGIPTYTVGYSPAFLVRPLPYKLQRGEHAIQTMWPYYNFPKIFAALPPEERERCREVGRRAIQERLSGKVDERILTGISAYDSASSEKLLEDTGRPRILILLHDFCDASHLYRSMLFPDFVEWCQFLFARAVKTPFDWYAKPHPNNRLRTRAAMNAANDRCIEELKAQFPTVRFLAPSVSNKQVVAEGIQSMFTVHGTAAHEFAYMGVPVVNGGENPHFAYDFNIHARSVEEYASYIERADQLSCNLEKQLIEEFFYMYYTHMRESGGTVEGHPIDPSVLANRDIDAIGMKTDVLESCMRSATPEHDAKIARYLDEAFSPNAPRREG